MDSSLVIKAKYGDTLRRFSVRVDENNRLDLNMVGLRAKICSVFNFATDANFILRYVDEDGDLVNLVDDEDLHDVMRQQLKFLRIDVHMINNSDVKSDADGSSGSATPLRANPVSDPFVADALLALPEPLREALYSSFSKAASSNPVLANIADSISKIGQSILKPQGNSHTAGGSGSGSGSKKGVPDVTVTPEAKGSQSPSVDSASGVSISVPDVLQEALSNLSVLKAATAKKVLRNFTDSISKTHLKSHYRGPLVAAGPSSKKNVHEELVTSEARGPQSPFPGSASDVNSQAAAYNVRQHVEAENMNRNVLAASTAGRQVDSGNAGIAPVDLNSSTNMNKVPLSSAVPVSVDKGKASIDDSFAGKHERCVTSMNSAVPSNLNKNPAISFGAPFDCPFSGPHNLHSMPHPLHSMPHPLGNFRIPPFKRSHSHSDALNGMFHKGVRCDGCGVYPITGPRFKSKVKENYDLCSICFNEFGNHTDYIRMDRPASFRGPRCLYQNPKEFRLPKIPQHVLKTAGKHARPRLDSRFILDVNVIDGTMMAPSTPFTKIWRMRNNGTIAWPKRTQLVWIGGDKLSESHSVDLEVPDSGISAEMELDIAVDFIAPQSPGRYISYWRMASLSGHKFGQWVWVLIQVDASLKDSFYDSFQGLNLNIPLGGGSSEGPQIIDINVQPVEDVAFHQPKNPSVIPAQNLSAPISVISVTQACKESQNNDFITSPGLLHGQQYKYVNSPDLCLSSSNVRKHVEEPSRISVKLNSGNATPIVSLPSLTDSLDSVAVKQEFIQQSDRERRSSLHSQVVKALSGLATVDEASGSNIPVLSGFSIPKLVLQIVTVDAIFRVTSPSVSELVILKETAFTVYSKARRVSRGISSDLSQLAFSSRSQSVLPQMPSPISGMWKDCVGPRMAGHSIPREGDIDTSLRPGSWDNSWQPTRSGVLNCDPSRTGDIFPHEEIRYMFEPLFILAEPGSPEHGISVIGSPGSETSKALADDSSGNHVQSTSTSGSVDSASSIDGSGSDQKTHPSLHCCYGWTEDWRWLVCIWTDSRGELLDTNIFPFGGISSRQDTKGLQCLFGQVLQQGCLILQSCEPGLAKPRDFVIARIGGFYELEYLEWQKAIYSAGGSEMKRWPLQLRKSLSDGMSSNSNGSSLQQPDMSLIPERTLPSSPSPLYSPHPKPTGFIKGNLGQSASRKQVMGGHSMVENSRGLLHWAQSISFVAISMDHTLQPVLPADSSSPGNVEGFTPVKSLGSASSAYVIIPSPSMRFLPPTALQLPTCLTAESPPLAHLLHSKGSALPFSTGFVVSKAVASMRKDYRSSLKEEWPSVLSVSLIDYYGCSNITQEKFVRGINKQGGRGLSWEAKDFETETHLILESLAAELHALSWMTVSPAYLERRTALPFHCDMVLRLRRLLHFADKELHKKTEKS